MTQPPPQPGGQPRGERKTGTPQLVTGIVLVLLAVISAAGGAANSDSSAHDPARTAGAVAFRLVLLIIGIVLIVVGARIKSANHKGDLAAGPGRHGEPRGGQQGPDRGAGPQPPTGPSF